MVVITLLLTVVHLRQMARQEDWRERHLGAHDGRDRGTAASRARRRGRRRSGRRLVLNLVALAVFAVFAFPVYWMVITSFRRTVDIQSPSPQLAPVPGTLDNYRTVFERDFFWSSVRNSLIVTLLTVALALAIAFLAAVARVPLPLPGPHGVHRRHPARADGAGRGADHLAVQGARRLATCINTIIGLTLTYLVFVLPFTIWTLRGFVAGVPRSSRRRPWSTAPAGCAPSSR